MFYRKALVLTAFVLSAIYTIGNPLHPKDSIQVKDILRTLDINAMSSNTRSFEGLAIPEGNSNSDPIIIPIEPQDDSVEYHRAKALEYQEEVTRKQSFVSSITNATLMELPFGIRNEGSDVSYTIIVSRMTGTLKDIFVEAYVVLELPQTGDKIAFRGTGIKFSRNGGFTGDGRLELIGSYPIKFNDKTLLTLLGKGNR
jgi:hypothetical protein